MITFLAEPSPSPSGGTRPIELWEASPGLLGFILGFFILGIALVFLMWSMSKHLRAAKHNDPDKDQGTPDPDPGKR